MIIGILSGLAYFGVCRAMKALWLDDPLDAVAVHFGGGMLYKRVEKLRIKVLQIKSKSTLKMDSFN